MSAHRYAPYGRLASILSEGKSPRILVVGDLILDRYLFGEVSRVSPEAPVPVLLERGYEERLGGAGNVLANLWGLGADAWGIGVVGEDAEGKRISSLLGDRGKGVVDPSRPTTVKTRAIARGQQVLRVDRELTAPIPTSVETDIIEEAIQQVHRSDAVVISDYGKGVCTPRLLGAILGVARDRGATVVVDPKGADFSRYRGAAVLTPNIAEAEEALGVSSREETLFLKAVADCIGTLDLLGLVVTHGSEGISLHEPTGGETRFPARARSVYDVTGAGDTVTAAMTVALVRGASLPEAVGLANLAAGIVVGKVGAVPVTREEILASIGGAGDAKVLPRAELEPALARRRSRGERVVFTNGCFDVLHIGHIRQMQHARALGDCLVVGLNTDRSVQAGKGGGRPVMPEAERAELVASLESVDYVTLFDEETPERLIEEVRPDVLVKGADYEGEVVVGREFVESYGGEVVLSPMVDGVSTTAIIERIQRLINRTEGSAR
ncbi:MAG: D-glycero-beta-D-manno-heptose 1-phosphate adenylyltransferase [Planctomycetota bacterium]|nr:D-glycero-beta-D-manno-heptose 1-phosphate adenylyltransferase [Planctomycetota bacterium]